MKNWTLTGVFVAAICTAMNAQNLTDTLALPLQEVLVSGIREAPAQAQVLPIVALNREKIARSGAATLCNALTELPGVSRLSTGEGIAKPVIRGLFGNRVLTLLSSLKFDNQQWQDEHGMGLSDIGVERVELIKGPASILYGSEAVGGVINVIEEQPTPDSRRQGDLNLRYDANTGGLRGDAGLWSTTRRGWWRLRAGAESHADYSDGDGQRVLNSRFDGYYLKGSLAFQNSRFQSINNYNCSVNRFGFVLEDLASFFDADARWSRKLDGPHHTVLLNVFSSQNTWWKKRGTLKLNAGVQSNLRLEDEGGGAISLNMHLVSLPFNLQWIQPLNSHNELIFSHIAALEKNTNYGARIIVPDANMMEQGLSVFFKHHLAHWILESGLGVQDKFIQTFETRGLNTPDKELRPFRRNRASGNALLGVVWHPINRWLLKLNAATGYRAPNLAELSSNGLHEGIFQYEIGRPDLHNEQNLNLESDLSYTGRWFAAGVSAFRNQFRDYVYLQRTNEDFFGFPVFRYVQSDARLFGGEATASLLAGAWKWANTGAWVRGERSDGSPLPFIPAAKYTSRLTWEGAFGKRLPKAWAFLEGEYVAAQKRPAINETATPDYFLLNAGIGTDVRIKGQNITLRLIGNNLLDRHYFDHLSRLKDYGIYNIGRNVTLSLRLPFNV